MSPIYQTITGELQCIMHEGVLMVREWPENGEYPNPNPWQTAEYDPLDLEEAHRKSLLKKATLADRRAGFRARCQIHCMSGTTPSPWRVKPKSEDLTDQIEKLMRSREEAILAEITDRPGVTA